MKKYITDFATQSAKDALDGASAAESYTIQTGWLRALIKSKVGVYFTTSTLTWKVHLQDHILKEFSEAERIRKLRSIYTKTGDLVDFSDEVIKWLENTE